MSDSQLEKQLKELESKLLKVQNKQEKEQQLKKASFELYKKNLAIFQARMPDIYQQFKDYEPFEFSTFYTSKGLLNIMEPESGLPLYDDDPIAHGEKTVDAFLSQKCCTDLSFQLQGNPLDQIHLETTNNLVELRESRRDDFALATTTPDIVPSLVLVGLGLGYHLSILLKKIEAKHIYIYEANPDFFYASLFALEWEEIFQLADEQHSTLYINIGSTPLDFRIHYVASVTINGRFTASRTYYLKHYPSKANDQAVEELKEGYLHVTMGWGFFDDGVFSMANGLKNFEKKIPFLKSDTKLPKKYRDIPIFVVGNGPSFDESLPYLKEYRDKVIIVSCGSAISTFYKAGIKPDIHVEVERTFVTPGRILQINDPEYFKDIFLLGNNLLHPDTYDIFPQHACAIKPSEAVSHLTWLKVDKDNRYAKLNVCNPLAANTGVSYATALGFEQIYLHGIDCGYRCTTRHHSAHSGYYEEGKDKEIQPYLGGIECEANFGGTVRSEMLYDLSRRMIERLIEQVKKGRKVDFYNTADGALIKGACPLPQDMILVPENLPDKNEVLDYIKREFFEVPQLPPFNSLEDFIDVDEFLSIVDKLLEYYDREKRTRKDVLTILSEQATRLLLYRQSSREHLFHMLEGSLYTMNALIIEMLYMFEDEQASVNLACEAIEKVRQFFLLAKEKYSRAPSEIDTYYPEVMKGFV